MNLAYFISTDVLNFSSWQLFADPQIFILTQKCVSYCVRSHMLSKTSKKKRKGQNVKFRCKFNPTWLNMWKIYRVQQVENW